MSGRLALSAGNPCGSWTDGVDASSATRSLGCLIKLRICSRASADSVVNRTPPVFCVASVQASAPSTPIRWLHSENHKRIIVFRWTGAMESKQSPPSETLPTLPPLSGSISIYASRSIVVRGVWRRSGCFIRSVIESPLMLQQQSLICLCRNVRQGGSSVPISRKNDPRSDQMGTGERQRYIQSHSMETRLDTW